MRTGERRKYQIPRIGLTVVHLHPRQTLIGFTDMFHIREVKPRIYAMRIHIHSHSHNVYITGSFSVSKQGSFNTVRPRKDSKLRRRYAAASVIMRMQAENYIISVIQMFIHIFQLTGEYMGHRILHRRRDVNDRFLICRRLPYVQHRIADFHRIVYFRPGKTLRAVLESKVSVRL